MDRPTSPSRYRHPGDVIRLIVSGVILVAGVVITALMPARLLGSRAGTVRGLEPDTVPGALMTGPVQVVAIAAVVAVLVASLRRRRFRLLGTLAGGAVVAGLVLAILERVLGHSVPPRLTANLAQDALVTNAGFPHPAFIAGAVAVTVAIGPWLAHSWRRAAWSVLGAAAVCAWSPAPSCPWSWSWRSPPGPSSPASCWSCSALPIAGSGPPRSRARWPPAASR